MPAPPRRGTPSVPLATAPEAPSRRASPRALLVLMLALVAAGCTPEYVIGGVEGTTSSATSAAPGVTTCDAPLWPVEAGGHARSVTHQGRERTFTLWLPQGHDPCKAMPVVVALRGAAATLYADGELWNSRFFAEAQQYGFAVVLPDATPVGVTVEWNAPLSSPAVDDVDDVGFVSVMLGSLQGRDPTRTYLAGAGTGGIFAHTLAARLPVFAAVAVVAGTLGGRDTISAPLEVPPAPKAPTSVIMIHGRDDGVFPIEGGVVKGAFVLGLDAARAFWVTAGSCSTPAETTMTGKVTRQRHPCPGGRDVLAISVSTLGHAWPEDATNLKLRASEAVFTFFAKHAL